MEYKEFIKQFGNIKRQITKILSSNNIRKSEILKGRVTNRSTEGFTYEESGINNGNGYINFGKLIYYNPSGWSKEADERNLLTAKETQEKIYNILKSSKYSDIIEWSKDEYKHDFIKISILENKKV